jgi:hypothetical protein
MPSVLLQLPRHVTARRGGFKPLQQTGKMAPDIPLTA